MQVIGHRGARDEAPENTIPGFAYAVQLGLQAVEFDVRLARDGELVVIHDATVDRTTDCSGEVSSFSSEELAGMDARAEHSTWPERCGIPTLREVLDVVDHLPRLVIEIKANRPDGLDLVGEGVLDIVRSRGLENQATITSFDPAVLELVQRLAPEQSRGLIGNGDSRAFLEAAQRLGCDQIDVRLATSSVEIMTASREAGLRTVAWPCNADEDLEKACAWQPDMLTTDRPAWLQGVMTGLEAGGRTERPVDIDGNHVWGVDTSTSNAVIPSAASQFWLSRRCAAPMIDGRALASHTGEDGAGVQAPRPKVRLTG